MIDALDVRSVTVLNFFIAVKTEKVAQSTRSSKTSHPYDPHVGQI
jgi:hypothetical protein